MQKSVRDRINRTVYSDSEKSAIRTVLDAGSRYGYGNLMAWLATEWAVMLRDECGLSEITAIDAVSNRGPYSLPQYEVQYRAGDV